MRVFLSIIFIFSHELYGASDCNQMVYTNHESSLDLIKIDQKHESLRITPT